MFKEEQIVGSKKKEMMFKEEQIVGSKKKKGCLRKSRK